MTTQKLVDRLVEGAPLLQILEESIKSSIIADTITPKLLLCLYFHKHLELGNAHIATQQRNGCLEISYCSSLSTFRLTDKYKSTK